MSFLLTNAMVSKTINVTTAGTLGTLLTATDKTSVTDLIVTGNIDTRDIKCMRDELIALINLDMGNAVIVAFTGTGGTTSRLTVELRETLSAYPPARWLWSNLIRPTRLTFSSLKGSVLLLPGELLTTGND